MHTHLHTQSHESKAHIRSMHILFVKMHLQHKNEMKLSDFMQIFDPTNAARFINIEVVENEKITHLPGTRPVNIKHTIRNFKDHRELIIL